MNKKNAFFYAFIYLSALIGAGFATGKELNFYFFRYGKVSGITGVFAAAVLFAASAYKTLITVSRNSLSDCREVFVYLFGNTPGRLFHTVANCFFIVLFAAMTASFGEIANDLWNIPKNAAGFVFCVFCLLASAKNSRLTEITSIILCPCILLGCPVLALSANTSFDIAMPDPAVIGSAVIYTSYNLLTSTAVLCGCKKADKKTALLTAVIIFAAFFISGSLFGMLSDSSSQLPVFENIKNSPTKCVIYTFILLCAIITTALCNLRALPPKMPKTAAVITGYLISLCGFGKIVENLYFIFGLIGCAVLTALML